MCGIAGLVDRQTPPDEQLLLALARPLERRGPDDYGSCIHADAGLVHRRLSVIDIDGGHQPLYNEDRTLALVFNGEIYDYQALRTQLTAHGHHFTTASDSEVLLHLYEEHGPDMLHQLNGMFAFAILHIPTGDLFIARDRFGQKPLFYATADQRLAFASGPRSLAALPWVDTTLNPSAIHDFLELTYIPTPRSIYQGIAKLPPGHYATWQANTLTIHQWWEPTWQPPFQGSYQDAQAALRTSLTAAVHRRLVADVPLGLFLSGGLDSSIICAIAKAHLGDHARTYSIGFPDPRYDERKYAQHVADHLGTQHHCLEVKPNDFDYLQEIVGVYEEPYADASMLPTSLLSRYTRQHVTVALSGDAADELFGGYYRHRAMHLAQHLSHLPLALRRGLTSPLLALLPPKREERTRLGKLHRILALARTDGLDRYWSIISRLSPGLKETLYGPAMRDGTTHTPSIDVFAQHYPTATDRLLVERIMQLDLRTYLPDDILVKVDRASMAYGLEVRTPFLDKDLVQLALSFPYAWKQHGKRRKIILADTFGDLLPPTIPGRPKMGFGVPLAAWLRDTWREPTHQHLLDGQLVSTQLFHRPALETLLHQHQTQQADHSYLLYALLTLELWLGQR